MTAASPVRALLALGSNLGDRASHLAHALRRLGQECELAGVSSVYESEPVGHTDQPRFLNMVAGVRTRRSPRELLDLALAIEAERSRTRSFTGAPRTLDLDLLLYGDREVHEPGLRVPHPRMTARAFVLVPLLEVEPDATEPGAGRTYAEYLTELSSAAGADDLHALGLRRIMDGEELLDGETG